MDFLLNKEQEMLKKSLKEFLAKEVTPFASERDAKGALNREEVVGYIKKLMPFGFYTGALPEKDGGLGLDNTTCGMIYEELAYSWCGLAGCINLTDIGMFHHLFFGNAGAQEKYRDRIKKGELITSAGISEPNVGSDTQSIETTATLEGDYYIVNGTKSWISNGPIADICITVVQTDKSKGAAGIRMLLIDNDESPYERRELPKIGMHAFPTGELYFDNCRVPKENMIPASSYLNLMKGFDTARVRWSFHVTGLMQAALDASIKYAKSREQFGRPIGKFQMVQDMIYEMYSLVETSRLLSYRGADMLDKGLKCRKEASLAKGYSTEAAIRVTSLAIEIHGANGLSQEFPLERYFRDARVWTIPDGTTEIQKLIVSGELLKIRGVK